MSSLLIALAITLAVAYVIAPERCNALMVEAFRRLLAGYERLWNTVQAAADDRRKPVMLRWLLKSCHWWMRGAVIATVGALMLLLFGFLFALRIGLIDGKLEWAF